ncbi:MAG TPA: hypothetical protein VHP36_04170 [Chitinispirillaceae bacterium]|nr:hypothetical protein [Chitinispirillaceae bacterium]
MVKWYSTLLFAAFLNLACAFSAFCSDSNGMDIKKAPLAKGAFRPQPYSSNRDMAFVSVFGSRPDAKKLQGFQRAVLFNARGELVTRVDMRNDSIYSLDRMIQENKSKGPLVVKMYR